jgi:hypothetical protein
MLHEAVAMGHNIIPEPAGAVLASEAEVQQLFPFTWNISQFRGRSIDERGLIVHYVPQASRNTWLDSSPAPWRKGLLQGSRSAD